MSEPEMGLLLFGIIWAAMSILISIIRRKCYE